MINKDWWVHGENVEFQLMIGKIEFTIKTRPWKHILLVGDIPVFAH